MPIEIAIQRDVIEKLDHFDTLDNFQLYILKQIYPNYMKQSSLHTVQLLQNYA